MAGTDRSQAPVLGGPSIILVRPQLGQNIGAVARAMLNFGLTDLRLVAPRDGWPNDDAIAMASRADRVLAAARLYDRTEQAIADLNRVYAATARSRDMAKPVVTARRAAVEMRALAARRQPFGVLFGPERAGLDNDEVVLADAVLAVPANPGFSSLNLAQAALLVGYEWFQAGETAAQGVASSGAALPADARPANKGDMVQLFEHLEAELEAGGYFRHIAAKRPSMIRNIRNIFQRAELLESDVRTLRGVIRALTGRRAREGRPPRRG